MTPAETKYLVVSGSRRADSLNSRLASLAARVIANASGVVDAANIREFDCPSYDGDVEQADGIPAPARDFRERLDAVDALVLVSPEYNASMPGIVKNVIDWVSRFRPQPFHQKHCLLMSASPSMVGGNRGLWSLRVPLEHLGMRVYPDMFSLAQASGAFGESGELANEMLQGRFEQTVGDFMELVEASAHYPCAKAKWVEFLGEHPGSAIDRVE